MIKYSVKIKDSYINIALGVALVIAAGGAVNVCLNYQLTSDDIQPALYFYDIAENGNYLLKGWHLVNNSFLFTNVSIYIVLGFIFGMGPIAMKAGAIWALALLTGAFSYVVYKAWDGRTAMLGALMVVGATPQIAEFLIQPCKRTGTIMFGFLSVAVLFHLINSAPGLKKAVLSALLFTLSFLAAFSDPYFLVSFTAPALAAYLALRLGGRRLYSTKDEILYACLIIIGTLGGKWIAGQNLAGPTIIGGSAPMSPIGISRLPGHALFFLERLSHLFGLSGAKALITVPLFAGFLALSYMIFRRTEDSRRTFLARYMLFMGLLLSFSFVIKDKEFSPALARYLFPLVFVYAFVLAASLSGERMAKGRAAVGISFVIAVSIAMNAYGAYSYSPPKTALPGLARFLEESGMKYGYAEYWKANSVTFYSDNRIKSRPVKISGKNVMAPYFWFSKPEWYSVAEWDGPTFLILGDGDILTGFDSAILGEPSRTLKHGAYTIMEWPFNIMTRLLTVPITERTRRDAGSFLRTPDGTGAIVSRPGERGTLLRMSISTPAGRYDAVFGITQSGALGGDALTVAIRPFDAKKKEYIGDGAFVKVPSESGERKVFVPFVSPGKPGTYTAHEITVASTGASGVTLRPPVIELR